MSKSGFFVDTKSFDKEFSKVIKKTIPKLTRKGLFNAAWEALRDANKKEPFTPWDIGDLAASGEVHENKDLFKLFIEFGFNRVYAARLHEDGLPTWNWTKPGSGPKYLTTKLIRYKDKYIEIVAETIKDGQRVV